MSSKSKSLPNNTPAIGTKLYHVSEHLYYIPDHAGPLLEYVVCELEVTGYYFGGFIEIMASGNIPGRGRTPVPIKLATLDKETNFRTAKAAAQFAEQITNRYENAWSWLGSPDIPLRRPWAYLLERN